MTTRAALVAALIGTTVHWGKGNMTMTLDPQIIAEQTKVSILQLSLNGDAAKEIYMLRILKDDIPVVELSWNEAIDILTGRDT